MTESDYSSNVSKHMKDRGYWSFKHSDRFTAAIPDHSFTGHGWTTWVEVKKLKRGETPSKRAMIDKEQLTSMVMLEAGGRAFYVIVDLNGYAGIHSPRELYRGIDEAKITFIRTDYPQIERLCAIHKEQWYGN